MPVAAVIGASVVGAAGSAIAGSSAAGAQRDATAANTALQQQQMAENARQYDQNRADLAPYRNVGYQSLGTLANQMGVSGATNADGTANPYYDAGSSGSLAKNFTAADFQKDPGYDFRMSEGAKAVDNSAAARGGVLSGGALKAMARYGQDFASNEYGAAYNRFNNDQTTRFNRLSALAGTGQTATNSGIAAGNELQSQNQTGVNNIMSQNNASANATASQYAGIGNSIAQGANNVGSYYAMKNLYNPVSLSQDASYTIAKNPGIF